MRGLNLKELIKQIKFSGKRSLIWSRDEGHHYITNRHWMIRFPGGEMPREVLVTLFSIFAEIPKKGRALLIQFGNYSEVDAINVQGVYSSFTKSSEGESTPFIKDLGDLKMRAFRWGNEVIYINESYTKMVDLDENKPLCSGKMLPVFFMNGAVILLPYRSIGENDKEILDELIAG